MHLPVAIALSIFMLAAGLSRDFDPHPTEVTILGSPETGWSATPRHSLEPATEWKETTSLHTKSRPEAQTFRPAGVDIPLSLKLKALREPEEYVDPLLERVDRESRAGRTSFTVDGVPGERAFRQLAARRVRVTIKSETTVEWDA
jgi:hypothetical protein